MANYPDSLPSATPATHEDVNNELIAVAAELDAHKAAGGGGGGDFTTQTYVPTITQGGASLAKNVRYASFVRVGDWVFGSVLVTMLAAGVAGSIIVVTPPLPADYGADNEFPLAVGAGWGFFYNTSTGEDVQENYTVALVSGTAGIPNGTPAFVLYRRADVHTSPESGYALKSGYDLTLSFAYQAVPV